MVQLPQVLFVPLGDRTEQRGFARTHRAVEVQRGGAVLKGAEEIDLSAVRCSGQLARLAEPHEAGLGQK